MSEQGEPSIRSADLTDSEAISRLVTQLGYDTTPAQMGIRIGGLISHPDYELFVATCEEVVIGIAGVWTGRSLECDRPYGRIIGLAVDQAFRRNGVGRALMRHVESWVKSRGAAMLMPTSGSHRTEAHAFYEHLGYARTGVRFMKPF